MCAFARYGSPSPLETLPDALSAISHDPFGVQAGLEEMQLALRVLTAITMNVEPDAGDLKKLAELAPPHLSGLPPDELACYVIKRAVQRREELRHQRAS